MKDYLSLAAIFISLVSLGISIWSARFSRRAKASELRAAVLGKAAEVSSRLTHIAELNGEMRFHAESLKDFEGFMLVDNAASRKLHQRADTAYRRLSAIPVQKGLDVYESFFHEFQALNEYTMRYEQSTQTAHDRYLAIQEVTPSAV